MKGKNKMVIRLLGITKESIVRVDEKTKQVRCLPTSRSGSEVRSGSAARPVDYGSLGHQPGDTPAGSYCAILSFSNRVAIFLCCD